MLAAKEMFMTCYYIKKQKWIAAINKVEICNKQIRDYYLC